MVIIKQAYKEIRQYLGEQEYNENDTFHPSVFVVKESTLIGELLYNTFTGEIVLADKVNDIQYLKRNWYCISNKYDEFEILESIRKLLIDLDDSTAISTYTIFPTTNCNARCFYCFEEGRSKKNMSKETAMKVASYISRNRKNEIVSIRWFGGEPLYNQMAIDTICSSLNEEKIKFTSKMATNGFLFSQWNIEKACCNWHLKYAQITIDGTESVYNRVKNFQCNQNINPFQRVLDNIDLLTSNSINVIIRLNVDLSNISDIINLVKNVLLKRFNSNRFISIYSHLLLDSLSKIDIEDHKHLFMQKEVLDNLLYTNGFSCHVRTASKFKLYRCIADNKKSVTILPNGQIGLCEHFSEDHFVSDINSFSVFNINEVSFLRTRLPKFKMCSNCSYYPFCIRLECCPEAGTCSYELKKHNIRNLHRELLSEFEIYLEDNKMKTNSE